MRHIQREPETGRRVRNRNRELRGKEWVWPPSRSVVGEVLAPQAGVDRIGPRKADLLPAELCSEEWRRITALSLVLWRTGSSTERLRFRLLRNATWKLSCSFPASEIEAVPGDGVGAEPSGITRTRLLSTHHCNC